MFSSLSDDKKQAAVSKVVDEGRFIRLVADEFGLEESELRKLVEERQSKERLKKNATPGFASAFTKGAFKRGAEKNDFSDDDFKESDFVTDEPLEEETTGPKNVVLSNGHFEKIGEKFGFNKEAKMVLSAKAKEPTTKKKVTFELFSRYKGAVEDMKAKAEGFIENEIASAQIKLFINSEFHFDEKKSAEDRVEYFFKASHPEGTEIHTSENLLMPERKQLHLLEMTGVNFHNDRKVLLPDIILENPNDIQTGVRANAAFVTVLKFHEKNPDKLLLVAGHTDPKGSESHNDDLSVERAVNILLYITGKMNDWASHSFKNHAAEDIQFVLLWASQEFGFDCLPGEIDNDFGTNSKKALNNFRNAFQNHFKSNLYTQTELKGNTPSEVDFLAFYICYDDVLARSMDIEIKEIQSRKENLTLTDPAGIGCGENFQIQDPEAVGEDSLKNRRVDLLFFDPGELPELKKSPPGQEIYGDSEFEILILTADFDKKKLEPGVIFVQHVRNENKPIADVNFRLFKGTEVVESGKTDAEGIIQVEALEPGEFSLELDSQIPPLRVEIPFEKDQNPTEPLIVQSERGARAHLIELGDISFNTNHEILLPDIIIENPNDVETGVRADAVFKKTLEFLDENPEIKVLVAGHTDTVGQDGDNDDLSTERAMNVLLYLSAKKEAWAEHSFKFQEADDYQFILLWAHREFGFDCNPGEIDNDFGSGSKTALKNFRRDFNAHFETELFTEAELNDGTRKEVDWLGFYICYDDVLSRAMGISLKELETKKQGIKFTDPQGIGCGENFPIENPDQDNFDSLRNRRVDILFFEPGEEPDLTIAPPGQPIYGDGGYILIPIGTEDLLLPKIVEFFARPASHDNIAEKPHNVIVPPGEKIILHVKLSDTEAFDITLFKSDGTTGDFQKPGEGVIEKTSEPKEFNFEFEPTETSQFFLKAENEFGEKVSEVPINIFVGDAGSTLLKGVDFVSLGAAPQPAEEEG